MIDLNDVKTIRLLDAHDMLGYVADLPQQLIDGWAAAEAIDLPLSFGEIDRVVVAGMGGLASSGALFAALVTAECQLPIAIVRDYTLPAHAHGTHTLVITISYSGETEETLAVFDQAQQRGCQSLVLAANGQLLERARKGLRRHVPFYDRDRYFAPDIEKVKKLVKAGVYNTLIGKGLMPSL